MPLEPNSRSPRIWPLLLILMLSAVELERSMARTDVTILAPIPGVTMLMAALTMPALLIVVSVLEPSAIAVADRVKGLLAGATTSVGVRLLVATLALIEAPCPTLMMGTLANLVMLTAVAMPPLVPLTEAVMVPDVVAPRAAFSALRSTRGMAA